MDETETEENANKGVTVVVHKDREDETSRLPAGVRVVSIICLAIGVLALVTQSLIEAVRGRALYTFYEGFVEAGLLFGIGGIGLWALRSPSRNKSRAFLVMSIIGALWSLVVLIFTSFSTISAIYGLPRISRTLAIAVVTTTLLWSIAAGITCVAGSALSCRGLCCRSKVNTERVKGKALTLVSAAQILVGSIFLVCYPLNVNLVQTFSMWEEIWCGLIFILIGVFGIFAARRKSVSWLTVFIVLCVFGLLFIIVILVTTSIKTAFLNDHRLYEIRRLEDDIGWMKDDEIYNCTERTIHRMEDHNRRSSTGDEDTGPEPLDLADGVRECEEDRAKRIMDDEADLMKVKNQTDHHKINLAILSIQIILVILEMGITIASMVFACGPLCSKESTSSTAYYISEQQLQAGVVHVTKEDTQPTDRFVGGNEEALATTSGGHSKYSRID